ncbi:SCP2 sterol-binding domain-containing protein [Pararhodospirillum oryzae]|uniref:Sterol-binding protein n=1 Tax=Pararhodospirillum oryzae TaxID=478448 RepID=A0A512H3F9_9PROT|nr:SCP2 sterol-binding domain-containing protein [Pararhodospirillum oryzae]GEO79948.1 sterol-binding protein [Pararhodospirillum oryzae]
MSETEKRLREALPRLDRLGAVVRLDLGAAGCWRVDARANAQMREEDEADEDDLDGVACTVRLSADTLERVMEGRLDPVLGYTLGKIKVAGSRGVALKLVGALA